METGNKIGSKNEKYCIYHKGEESESKNSGRERENDENGFDEDIQNRQDGGYYEGGGEGINPEAGDDVCRDEEHQCPDNPVSKQFHNLIVHRISLIARYEDKR